MLDSKFFATFAGLAIAIFVIASVKTAQSANGTFEGFGMLPSFQAVPECNPSSSICNTSPYPITPAQNGWGGDRAGSRTNENRSEQVYYRPSAGPSQGLTGTVATNVYNRRFPNQEYLAAPDHNLPEAQYLAAPQGTGASPIGQSEGYRERYGQVGKPSKYGAEFYGQLLAPETRPRSGKQPNYANSLVEGLDGQVGDMINGDMDAQRIIGQRLIFANRNSRLRGRGDPIRGDLPIVPNATGWFQVSVRPEVDLQGGALNVIAGVANAQGQAVSNMMVHDSADTMSAVGGTVVNPNNRIATSFPAYARGQ